MNFTELTKARRSCRSFEEDRQIDVELIKEIVRESQLAPSWKNSQTAKYYVANSSEAIAKVREALPEFNQNSSKGATLVVTTFLRDISGFTAGAADNELSNKWGAYDLGLAAGYFILSAKDKGLDTLILGIRDANAIRKAFNIPKTEQIVSVIALGYAKNQAAAVPKRKSLDEILTIL